MTKTTLLMCVLVFGGIQAKGGSADVTGDWRAVDVPIRMQFETDGSKLSGSVVLRDATALPILDGKVERGALSFKLADDRGGTIAFSGQISNDSIKFSVVGKKFPKTFTAIRAKS